MHPLSQQYFRRYAGVLENPGPLGAAFFNAIDKLEIDRLLQTLNEETITASLFAGVFAGFPLCASLFPVDETVSHKCSWGHYKKSRDSDPAQREADSGADFALVFWDDPEWAKIALFQAKKLDVGVLLAKDADPVLVQSVDAAQLPAWKQDALRIPPDRFKLDVLSRPRPPKSAEVDEPTRPPQLVQLADHGIAIMKHVRSFVPDQGVEFANLNWIHYLSYAGIGGSYRSEQMFCTAVAGLATQYKNQKGSTIGQRLSGNTVDIADVSSRCFVDVLASGFRPGESKGWLQVPSKNLSELLPTLVEFGVVVIGDDKGGVAVAGLTDDIVGLRERQFPVAKVVPRPAPRNTSSRP